MDTALNYSFPSEVIVPYHVHDEKTIAETSTWILIDPVNFRFEITYEEEEEQKKTGTIRADMTRSQFQSFLEQYIDVYLNQNYRSEPEDIEAETVSDKTQFSDDQFQESDSFQLHISRYAIVWATDRVFCKVHRGNEISEEEYTTRGPLEPGENSIREPEQAFKGSRKYHYELRAFFSIFQLKRDLGNLLPKPRRNQLNSHSYGERAIQHIREADYCFELDLFLPALASYIHAIEWTIIMYLKIEAGRDAIREQQEGNQYYKFSQLVEFLADKADLDQMTVARLEALNEAHRRWMAHHKSGQINETDLRNVRARLDDILEYLFD